MLLLVGMMAGLFLNYSKYGREDESLGGGGVKNRRHLWHTGVLLTATPTLVSGVES